MPVSGVHGLLEANSGLKNGTSSGDNAAEELGPLAVALGKWHRENLVVRKLLLWNGELTAGVYCGANMENTMWTLLILGTVLLMVAITLGLFKAAGLKRVDDLIHAPEKANEWDRLREK